MGSNNHILIDFSGNPALVKKAFCTKIPKINVDGVENIANMADPKIPAGPALVAKDGSALRGVGDRLSPDAHRHADDPSAAAGCGLAGRFAPSRATGAVYPKALKPEAAGAKVPNPNYPEFLLDREWGVPFGEVAGCAK